MLLHSNVRGTPELSCFIIIAIMTAVCLFVGSILMLIFGLVDYIGGSSMCPEGSVSLAYRSTKCINENNTIVNRIHIDPNYTTDIILISISSFIFFVYLCALIYIIFTCCECKNGKCYF